ncbi:hypothetical protein D9758_017667 [Tetrapyrgos nigripes]|uniref:Uncharacterized protein n=1 Tax=Tetrapyrgos nigripes TaxID=182062 RepID=A0A8H5FF05_9AGAR|nr:hypothetical protein D9758_017667 [Tetrapyrgos nigripes]
MGSSSPINFPSSSPVETPGGSGRHVKLLLMLFIFLGIRPRQLIPLIGAGALASDAALFDILASPTAPGPRDGDGSLLSAAAAAPTDEPDEPRVICQ